MISIASVLTVTVLTLPSDSFQDYASDLKGYKFQSEYIVDFTKL
jgi:hypothetical protein